MTCGFRLSLFPHPECARAGEFCIICGMASKIRAILIVITRFQAAYTLGRLLVERHPEVNVFGEPLRLRADVWALDERSGHADQAGFREGFGLSRRSCKSLPCAWRATTQQALAAVLAEELHLKIVCPLRGESFDLD